MPTPCYCSIAAYQGPTSLPSRRAPYQVPPPWRRQQRSGGWLACCPVYRLTTDYAPYSSAQLSLEQVVGCTLYRARPCQPPLSDAEPGDLLLHEFGARGSDVYADVFVIHPWSATHPYFDSFQVRSRMDREFESKSRLYDALITAQEGEATFLPLGFDVFGGMHARTSDLLLVLQRRLSGGQLDSGHLASTGDFSAFQFVSLCLARCIGVQLASHLPMHVRYDSDPPYVVPDTHADIPSHV